MTRLRSIRPASTRRARSWVTFAVLAPLFCHGIAWATGPAGSVSPVGPRAGFPAGPTPRNPAGPTPLNPAGPTPLNPAGTFGGPRFAVRGFGSASDPLVRPQPFVGVVGPSAAPVALGGSFFCGVHNRGFATQQFFFDHLLVSDGVAADVAAEMLVDGGGVWVFTGE